MAIQKFFSVLFLHLALAFLLVELTNAGGLQLGFCRRACPDAELIVHETLHRCISRDPTLAAPLLRMYFHDCFIRCPGVVSCSDVMALVARDAVLMIDGPYWDVPTGRRDGRVSIANEVLFNLTSPFANITVLKQQFAATGLSVKDLAVLSGKGDTDPSLDPSYAAQPKKKCKPGNSNTVVEMDPGSFNTFDEDYYSTIVAKRRGLPI
ncbi:hypothetical protein POTOM_028753 [Populus tomentosa]|uniref:peroxidase n=1 Tax=Populus tomentosa TaxID=118781 RepID=A0A8X7Z9L1_POPTO|nr:hypothetical protein POTOM_028753 [Populus tomentosa]